MTFRQKLLGLAGAVAVGAAYYYNAAVVNATVMGVVAKVAGVFAGMSFGAMAGFAVAGLVGFGLYKLVKAANGIADSFKQGLEDAGTQLDREDAIAWELRVKDDASVSPAPSNTSSEERKLRFGARTPEEEQNFIATTLRLAARQQAKGFSQGVEQSEQRKHKKH